MDSAALEQEFASLRKEIDNIKRGGHVAATVIGNNTANKTVTVQVVNPDGTSQNMVFPVATNFIPEAGSKAVVTVNGLTPLVLPLNGQTVAADGSWIRSPNYVAGVSGWKIDADGSAEFNNVVIRGTLSASVIDKATLFASQYAGDLTFLFNGVPNPGFEVNTTGWSPGANTTMLRVTTPVNSGVGALRLTATAIGDISVVSATGTSGVIVDPGTQYQVTCSFRANTTFRGCLLNVLFYDAAGALITTWNNGVEGKTLTTNDSNAGYVTVTTNATAPPRAAFAAIWATVKSCAAGEIHFIDDANFSGGAYVGFCPDADPDGAYTNEEGLIEAGHAPIVTVGFADFYAYSRSTGSAGLANIAAYTSVVPGKAYTVSTPHLAIDSATGATVRAFMAFYGSNSLLLDVQRGVRPYRGNNVSEIIDPEESFLAPAGADSAFYGFTVEPSGVGTGRGRILDVNGLNLYETTVIESAVMVPSAQASNSRLPAGSIVPYAGVATGLLEVIDGWLPRSGQAVSRIRYADLFAEIGTLYGAGDGSTTFTLPDDWVSYTPTWATSGGAPSIGNGTLTGRYRILSPKTVIFQVFLTFGSTTSGGSGTFTFTLPFVGRAGGEQNVTSKAFTTGGFNYSGVGLLGSSATVVTPYFPTSSADTRLLPARNSNTGAVGEGQPLIAGNYPWTNGSNLWVGGVYESVQTTITDLIKT